MNNPVNFSPNGGKFSASFSSYQGGGTGEPGKDGLTPHIGENGNWWIGEEDTGVKAQGADGKDYVLTEADKKEIADLARADLEDIIGDIDSALDDLHAYAQSLISGGATV